MFREKPVSGTTAPAAAEIFFFFFSLGGGGGGAAFIFNAESSEKSSKGRFYSARIPPAPTSIPESDCDVRNL